MAEICTKKTRVFCGDCRYLSDRIHKAYVYCTTHVESKCLNERSPFYGDYQRENGTCCFAVRGPAVDAYEGSDQ